METYYQSMIMEKVSSYDFHETVSMLVEAARRNGMRVFTIIDQSAAAADAGFALRPTTLIAIGRPLTGSRLMHTDPRTALVLPLRIAIWQNEDTVAVAHERPSSTLAAFDLGGSGVDLFAMDRALEDVTAAVADVMR